MTHSTKFKTIFLAFILIILFSKTGYPQYQNYSYQKYYELIPGPYNAVKDYATVPKFPEIIATSCMPTKIDNPLIKGRALKVSFPDGREVTVIGHIHGLRQFDQFIDLIWTNQLVQLSQSDFENYFIRILKENKQILLGLPTKSYIQNLIQKVKNEFNFDPSHIINLDNSYDIQDSSILNHARSDYQFLNEQIKFLPSKRIFIGYESNSNAYYNILKNYLNTYYKLNIEIDRRKKLNQFAISNQDIEDTILSSSMGQMYFFLKNPKLLSHINFLPTESNYIDSFFSEDDQTDKYSESLSIIEDKINEVAVLLDKNNQKHGLLLVYLSYLYSVHYKIFIMNYKNEEEIESDFEIISKLTPENFKHVSLQFKNDVFKRFKFMHFRNYNSALQMSKANMSGYHFVGLNHLYDTAYILSALCNNEMLNFRNKRSK